jgi:hypothetical protein
LVYTQYLPTLEVYEPAAGDYAQPEEEAGKQLCASGAKQPQGNSLLFLPKGIRQFSPNFQRTPLNAYHFGRTKSLLF